MYRAWGAALLPGASFPVVVDQLEALGKTHGLKLEMREVRYSALSSLEPKDKEDGGWLTGATAAPAADGAPALPPPAFALGGAADDDDDPYGGDDEGDELLALQAGDAAFSAEVDAADEAIAAPGPAPALPAVEAEDELVALMDDGAAAAAAAASPPRAPPQPGATAVEEQPPPPVADEEGDDELLAFADAAE